MMVIFTLSTYHMDVIINNKLIIKNPPTELLKTVHQTMRLPNPGYHQAVKKNPRLKFSPYFKEYYEYYEYKREENELHLPRGCFGRLDRFVQHQRLDVSSLSYETTLRPANFNSKGLVLRDYQQGITEAARGGFEGIFRLDTGFGKTVIALALMEQVAQKTLIIVPKLDLLNQFSLEYEKYFGRKPGLIQGKNMDIQDCTIATVQTLRNRINSGSIPRGEFGAVLCDEAHLMVPEKTRMVVEYFTAAYRYGFTATARRTDEQGEAIKFLFGDILIDKKIPREKPAVEILEYSGRIPALEYAEMIEYQTTLEDRNEMIAKKVVDEIEKGRQVLVLTKRVKHYETIHSLIKRYRRRQDSDGSKLFSFASSLPKSERDEILENLRKGNSPFSCILGTFSLLSTGIDIPSLDTLVIAGDLKSDVLAEQSAGRVLRLFEGKQAPLIVDIQDTGNGILKNQARLRRKFYQEQGWEIM